MKKPDLNDPKVLSGACLVFVLFSALVAVSVFFITLRGGEEVMVPDVVNKELTYALIELQNKELYPRIQLRYSRFAEERGYILEQDPGAGTIVKAGRRIRLVVSQGVLLSRAGNYIGRHIDDVRSELKALSGGTDIPLISIKEPVLYEISDEEPGTILEQDPPPDTRISGHTELSLVVSKGGEALLITMPFLLNKSFKEAAEIMNQTGARYEFLLEPADKSKDFGTVIAQEPEAGREIAQESTAFISVAEPPGESSGKGGSAGLFSYRLPENPYPMKTALEVILPSGERETLISMEYKGGNFTYPYKLPKGSVVILSILNREVHRETVE